MKETKFAKRVDKKAAPLLCFKSSHRKQNKEEATYVLWIIIITQKRQSVKRILLPAKAGGQ
jgi:hypothetical protein